MLVIFAISAYFVIEIKNNPHMETDIDQYMPQDHPAFIYSNKAESWFNGSSEYLYAVSTMSPIIPKIHASK